MMFVLNKNYLKKIEMKLLNLLKIKLKMILINLFMEKKIEKKFVFLGDENSINIEIIHKSHKFLKNKVKYILLGNIKDLYKYLKN